MIGHINFFRILFRAKVFHHVRKRRGPRASRTSADQGPHTVPFICAFLSIKYAKQNTVGHKSQ